MLEILKILYLELTTSEHLLVYNLAMKNLKTITELLNQKNIDFEIINFKDNAISARTIDTSLAGNYDPKNAIKTLVVRSKDSYKAVILKGTDTVNNDKLKTIIGKWSVVSKDVLESVFGFEAGSVCPLVLNIPLLVDCETLKLSGWSMGAGENNKGLNVTIDQIKKSLKFEIVSVAETITTKNTMNTEEKIKLITQNCEEVLTNEDLKALIESGTPLVHYIGFEISGMVHLGTGIICMGKVADFLKAGVKCQIFLADFHTYLNNKLDGTMPTIRWAAEHYFKQALIASLLCHGVEVEKEIDAGNLSFIHGFDLYEDNLAHWETFMEVGKHVTLSRNLRSISIMGKKQGDEVAMSTLFYPPLQVADIFTMRVNLAHAGMDQRKAHVVARQVAKKLTLNPLFDAHDTIIEPVAIHNVLIAGLTGPEKVENKNSEDLNIELKMSKSKPGSAIFVHDSEDEIRDKIKKAYGPPKVVEHNPLLNWVKTIVFWGNETGAFKISRPEKFGGDLHYTHYADIEKDYADGNLFPLDLKNALADWLIVMLKPARVHFEEPERKAALEKMKTLVTKN